MIKYIFYFLLILDTRLSYSANESYNGSSYKDDLIKRIYNGWPAKLGDVPYQVAFKMRAHTFYKIYTTFCGGTILTPDKLLSAAHCFVEDKGMCAKLCVTGYLDGENRKISPMVAVAGQLTNYDIYPDNDNTKSGQWRRLKSVQFPTDYDFPKLDIAVVRLRSPFTLNTQVNSIPYASVFVDYEGNCLASGFGRTSPTTSSSLLLLAHVQIIPYKVCSLQHGMLMQHFICISSQITDVGKGDSGGPLVCKNTGDPKEGSRGILVGVTSGHAFGVGSFFTRVSSYYSYIENRKLCNESLSCLHLTLLLCSLHWLILQF